MAVSILHSPIATERRAFMASMCGTNSLQSLFKWHSRWNVLASNLSFKELHQPVHGQFAAHIEIWNIDGLQMPICFWICFYGRQPTDSFSPQPVPLHSSFSMLARITETASNWDTKASHLSSVKEFYLSSQGQHTFVQEGITSGQ